MSSMPIEWHEECYRHNVEYVASLKEELSRIESSVADQTAKVDKYRRQIDRAKRLGKKAFDNERFRDQ